ncbi:MAG TPA: hypothetical protein VMJ10_33765 [Kofleriaceae bacterium]|nr:hypothetical protein [Kofleriaceae bacterium]
MTRTWTTLLLAACAHAGAADGNGFGVAFPEQSAHVGKHFQVQPTATCRYEDGRDARWATTGARVESGQLPPGIAIEDGALNGVPTRPGTFHAQLVFAGVTCAGKQLGDQHVAVTVTVR